MSNDTYPAITSAEVPVLVKKILIVEDEAIFAKAIQKQLKRAGYQADIAPDIKSATAMFKSLSPELVLLDMRLPDGSGLDFLSAIREVENSQVAVLVLSAYGEVGDAVSAMKLGASDYLKKPVDLDELMLNINKVFEKEELSRKLTYSTKRELHAKEDVSFLGECKELQNVREQVNRIGKFTAMADSIPPTVLILGETGTGKDVVARILHASSARSDKPFVHVDCASLPKDLIEAELFGHEKGAFTSAHVARTGLIEAAEDGVLFMDEIGELPLDLQAKLLAVLERRTLRRVGTSQERAVTAWIIAATNRDIASLSQKGEFRSDLYYRLNVLTITMPPLNRRGEDVILLAKHFADITAHRYGLPEVVLSGEIKQALTAYDWPGNIRELKHMIERAVLLSHGGKLTSDFLLLPGAATVNEHNIALDDKLTLESAELTLIKQALERTGNNVSRAARELGITRMALRYRIKKYNL